MTTDVDLPTAVSQQFPSATSRASADCPAFNIPADGAVALLQYLRDTQGFDFLMDVTAIDWTAEVSPRFTVVWHLYSSTKHKYVRIAANCPVDAEPAIPSVVSLWPGANWHERETYDMFGIKFTGHPDLRRILMWEAYPYFPLRKEFPLAGLPTDGPRRLAGVGLRPVDAFEQRLQGGAEGVVVVRAAEPALGPEFPIL